MPPSVVLGFTIATCYGCATHVVLGRRLWQWPLFWAAAVIGFFAGYVGGVALGVEFLRIGSVPLLASTVGAAILLWLAWYFSSPYAAPEKPTR